MSQFDESLERAASEVDTWPDWKLDTYSLNQRNKRSATGEQLPRPTKEQQEINELRSQVANLQRDKERLDWLECEKGGVAHEDPCDEFGMQYPWEAYSGLKIGTAIRVWKSTIREAIDAAMEAK